MLRVEDWEASKRVNLELEIEQLKQDASKSLKNVLVTREVDFVKEIASKEKQLEELAAKLQQAESELLSLQQQQQQSELHDEQIKHHWKQIKWLQQTESAK